jgi:hypothetical protein
MTSRKMFVILVAANLLTVALVTAAVQAGRVVASPAVPSPGGQARTIGHDPLLAPSVPWTMNYQGILKDSGGAPLSGQHDLTFTIYRYDQLGSGYTSSWTETHHDVQLVDGLFNVLLGSQGSPLRGDVFAGIGVNGTWDGDLALGISVDGGPELSPRVSLASVPYAHRADYVNRFPAPHWTSGWYAIAPGEAKTWDHDLGGSVDDYVVDLQFKDISGEINNTYYGLDFDNEAGHRGAHWGGLTASQITVTRGGNDVLISQVRVRIWRIQ